MPHVDPENPVRLTGEEAHHLAHVRRVRRGERVSLFDGSGAEWEAVVEQVGRRELVLSVAGRRLVDRELPFALTLACAPPKGDRLRWIVEKATELGVTRFVPLQTERTGEQVRGVNAEKMRRWVIEASKQCGRNVLMELSDSMPWLQLVDWTSPALLRILAHPVEHATELTQSQHQQCLTTGVVIAVGPEGGFTDGEVGLARQRGWTIADLGPRTLRVDTAALAMVAWLTLRFPPAPHSSKTPSPTS